jgi:hypothetical protein
MSSKMSTLPEGLPERPREQTMDTKGYLTKLRDIVQRNGVDVPISTCPGDGMVSAMGDREGSVSGLGDVEGIIPMPNVSLFVFYSRFSCCILTGF